MRCSSCSEEVKPVVAIDIDGTIGDYHGHFIAFAEKYLDTAGGGAWDFGGGWEGEFKDWCCSQWGIDSRTWRDIKLAYRQGAQKRSMPIYRGSAMMVTMLRSSGIEVWLTTTRPYLRLDNVDPDTRAWLDRFGIGYDGLLYDDDKYEILAERIDPGRVVAVLDDLPEQTLEAKRLFGDDVPILRRSRWNRYVDVGIIGAERPGLITRMIEERTRVWRRKTSI